METSGSDAAVTYLGKAEERDGYGELEHLPPLLEDEENVSLADILSLRDSCLSEEEVWAVCAECVVALQSIRPSHLFHTLCITPDTLAFNAHGNVCFMEQLSDDPEGSFVPPEFDNTGSTFEGHVYSLGSTLSAALNFVIEPELEAELGVEIQRLLEQMQEEKPEDRPLLQDILSLAESRLSHTSSAAVCRKLSSVGRRVLSIESVATFQDGQEGSWEARWQHPKPRCLLKRLSSDDNTKDLCVDSSYKANGLSRQQVCTGWDSSLWAEDMDSGDRDCMILTDELDCRSHNSSPVRRRAQQRLNRVRGALNRSCSVPDSNNPPCLSPPTHGDISIPVSDLTEIGADEHLGCKSSWSNRLQRLNRGRSCESYPRSLEEDCMNSLADNQMLQINEDVAEFLCSGETNIQVCQDDECKDCNQDLASPYTSCQELDMEHDSSGDLSSLNHGLYIPNNHMTKSMLCLNEESQDEWISLRELLTRCGRRLTVNELWALCYTCLSSLQTYIDFPAYLCLDTVYVGCEGEVLFLKPKNIGHRDEFYLAPEYQEHGIVTEKVCVYGVAAILWATAKFSLSPNQKLAMPRKLKRLLLEMAKRTPIERPTIVMAKKSCRDYLSRQGTDAETVWNELLSRVHPPASKSTDGEDLSVDDPHQTSYEEATQINSGFVPMATESRLAPVPGPVPHSYPVHKELQFPEAFTSTATHFTPIILTNEEDSEEESQNLGAAIEETVEEFNKSSEHIEERSLDLDFTAHSEDPNPTQTEPSLPTEESDPVNQVVMNKTLPVNSVSTLPNTSCLEVSLPPPLSSNLNSCGVFNNYLFRQDPKTGHLSLVPVQVRAPESVLGLDINLSLVLQSLQGLITVPESTDGPLINCQTVPERPEPQQYDPSSSYFNVSSISSDSPLEHSVPGAYNGQINAETRGENQSPSGSNFPKVHPALQEVIDLLKGEFSLDGCLDNGHEDIAMGECIFSLKDLQYCVFASVVRERFSDLYWEDDLLGVLHRLVNYSSTALASNEQPPSKAVKRAANTPPLIATAWRGEREVCLHGCLDLNGNIHTASCAAADTWEGSKARSCDGENEAALEEFDLGSEESENCICEGASTDRDSSDAGVMMEGGDHSAGGSDESPSEAEFLSGREGLPGARDEQMSPGCSEDMEDSDSLVSERFLPGSRAEGPGLMCSPAWALAFFGEDCFSPEVIQYAVKLGQHTGSPCLDVKTQELQQQLIIETRNLKKTRNFYQKLIQQERKNKGSESKLMLSKLKSQLEELRSKVAFLDCVKKYLEILCVDQWGLEVSLLPSLAAYGPGPLNLQSSEDPSVLSFGGSKGKKTLQAATPLGLMAYLYARNAAVEGYIQQFLYTYRFFCTPEQFLQFIMDKFISAAREGPDMSEDGVKIFHRSLDLLQFWITDCKAVDFTPKSSCVDTLENFINTEIIPVDSRGQALLAALRSPLSMTWSKGGGSQISFEEDDGSVDVHSSTEDLGRKWRISRVVEPSPSMSKEKAFSIAAALPIPCYGSLVDDLSNVCLHSEERLPFSQNEYSAQHVAQQLTLLQQDIFQGCHPVHLLNSRTQGIRDNVLNPNKNVSQHIPPAEGSGLLVTEGTPSDSYLQQLLTYSDSVTNWISGEIVICDSVKSQVALLTKYLWIGKHCYESRNFATAMQVLGGLENVIVRQLPAWKHLSSKVSEILEELRAVQVFLKSDDLCLMGGEQTKRRPTLPSVHILAMHIQQREIGAFTLTSGACKWTKLRSIAKLVSQVHAFQEVAYPYSPDRELQAYLRRRVARLSTSDIHLLAASNDSNFQQSTERQTHRIQNTLRRVKATFQ